VNSISASACLARKCGNSVNTPQDGIADANSGSRTGPRKVERREFYIRIRSAPVAQ
jgi:hypothetical protein